MKEMVISGSDVSFGLLEELMKQLKAGAKTNGQKGLTGNHLRAFLEHRNPFEKKELEKVLPYADEETESNYGYPNGFVIRSVSEQVETLLKHFPNLDSSHVEELASGDLPEGAEGWAVIPKFDKLGKTYHQALETVLSLIANDREFQNWREGELTEKHMKINEKTAQSHEKLNEQPGDFWVVPFQFGIRHRGKSVRRARAVFTKFEFGLGAYEVAILLLTHPDRIQRNYLNIDCAGVEYTPSADGDFFACLCFGWSSYYERLALDYSRTGKASNEWGSTSAFLPQ